MVSIRSTHILTGSLPEEIPREKCLYSVFSTFCYWRAAMASISREIYQVTYKRSLNGKEPNDVEFATYLGDQFNMK